ncbi:MAG: hypothetical protein WC622_06810, partial [Pedobacter sp.]|uniref:hypothetical protein n=1 Tax=Pedobacter sp. TaxID=1411316 RepID=UPI0035645FDF
GKPGSSRCGSICEPYTNRSGNNGLNGSVGLNGHMGNNGSAKVLTRGIFNVNFLKDFLSTWANGVKSADKDILMVIQSSGVSDSKN